MELVLVRGLPGSGKSTVAKKFDNYMHVETDQFWMTDDGVYNFDPTRIKDAHGWCLDHTHFLITVLARRNVKGVKGVVVSNTFTTCGELEPYFKLAQKSGIVPNVILCQSQFGSIHGVPDEIIEKMNDRFEYDLSPLFNKYKVIK